MHEHVIVARHLSVRHAPDMTHTARARASNSLYIHNLAETKSEFELGDSIFVHVLEKCLKTENKPSATRHTLFAFGFRVWGVGFTTSRSTFALGCGGLGFRV